MRVQFSSSINSGSMRRLCVRVRMYVCMLPFSRKKPTNEHIDKQTRKVFGIYIVFVVHLFKRFSLSRPVCARLSPIFVSTTDTFHSISSATCTITIIITSHPPLLCLHHHHLQTSAIGKATYKGSRNQTGTAVLPLNTSTTTTIHHHGRYRPVIIRYGRRSTIQKILRATYKQQ